MEQEARNEPASAAAGYWIAAAARGLGELDRAWQAAMAAWVRTGLTPSRAEVLRGDLDRLVLTAIIPDRARGTSAAPRWPAGGGRHHGHGVGTLQGRVGAFNARTTVAATMRTPPASAQRARPLAERQPGPHRVQHRFGEQQQRRFERGDVPHTLRQARVRQAELKHTQPAQRDPIRRRGAGDRPPHGHADRGRHQVSGDDRVHRGA